MDRIWKVIWACLNLGSSDKKRKLADEAYDLTDDNFTNNDDVPDKLSTFRYKTNIILPVDKL